MSQSEEPQLEADAHKGEGIEQDKLKSNIVERAAYSGFSNATDKESARLVNRNGQFNVRRSGTSIFNRIGIFHLLSEMTWGQYALLVLVYYLLSNVLFALIYVAIGLENLIGINPDHMNSDFFEAFFFSAQTLTTVGYGRVSPAGFSAAVVSAIESLYGLMSFSLITGVSYSRFSRPKVKISYSKNMIVAPFKGGRALMFRLANRRDNQLIEAEISVMAGIILNKNGVHSRQFLLLELERTKVEYLSLSWTVVHPITETSPFYNLSSEELIAADVEFLVRVKAFDTVYMSVVHSTTSYTTDEIKWGYKFLPAFDRVDGVTVIKLDRLNEMEAVELPAGVPSLA